MGKFIDLTGQVVGELTVLSRGPNNKRHTQWWCRCECGNVALVRGDNLRNGKTTQCAACGQRQSAKARRTNHEDIDGIEHKRCSTCKTWRPLAYFSKGKKWDGLRHECTFCQSYYQAMRRHGGDLTLEKYIATRCQPCVLTGIVNPLLMSVDRIDSAKGYTKDNVQPMLVYYNLGKKDRDDAEFKTMVAPVIEEIRRSKPAYY